jgi:hypothetical protein
VFAVPAFLLHFLQHSVHIKEQVFLLPAAVENDVVFVFLKRKTQPLHPQSNIFKGLIGG